eukprot:TRINITY_DN2679_c0_g1_i1.p1 TRINITY_DN2679_c0_g1~~TRINITY_DN2679_c0_g1_i1.p1  ORF type:complete len:175 (+),score=18.63 TRINITY_DN2679_c0_g1_i1:70-594(+)
MGYQDRFKHTRYQPFSFYHIVKNLKKLSKNKNARKVGIFFIPTFLFGITGYGIAMYSPGSLKRLYLQVVGKLNDNQELVNSFGNKIDDKISFLGRLRHYREVDLQKVILEGKECKRLSFSRRNRNDTKIMLVTAEFYRHFRIFWKIYNLKVDIFNKNDNTILKEVQIISQYKKV